MSTVDKATLLVKLRDTVEKNYGAASSQVDDVLAAVLSTKVLSEINVISVINIGDLPNLNYYDSPSGMIYYLEDIKIFAISSGLKWVTLDGKLIRSDDKYSQVLSWGSNYTGQLGDNTRTCRSSPVSVIGGFTDWCQVSGGINHSLTLKNNGTVWTWGFNGCGQLGDGTTRTTLSPVLVIGGFTDWCCVGSGGNASHAIRKNGTLWGWGRSLVIGDGTTTFRSSPVSVIGGFTDWCQISGGNNHTLALRSNGTAWAWGCNAFGQLGDNTTINKTSPVSVVGGFTDWCQISAGGDNSLALRSNGTAWAWGNGTSGRVGDNTIINKSSPVSVVGGFTDWCRVSVGAINSVGLRSNGTLWSWGINTSGQLGDNTTINKSSPVSVIGGFTDWCQISTGYCHSIGLRRNGSIWAWGSNNRGQLGDNTTIDKSSPVSVVGGFTDWYQISASGVHNLALRYVC